MKLKMKKITLSEDFRTSTVPHRKEKVTQACAEKTCNKSKIIRKHQPKKQKSICCFSVGEKELRESPIMRLTEIKRSAVSNLYSQTNNSNIKKKEWTTVESHVLTIKHNYGYIRELLSDISSCIKNFPKWEKLINLPKKNQHRLFCLRMVFLLTSVLLAIRL